MNLKIFRRFILTGCVFLLIAAWSYGAAQPGYAQTPEATPASTPTVIPTPEVTSITRASGIMDTADITFAQLQQPSFSLLSPIEQQSIAFDLPVRWQLNEQGTYVELNYDFQFQGNRTTEELATGLANVYFNDTLVGTFTPIEGLNQNVRIPINSESIDASAKPRNRFNIVYFSGNCDVGNHRGELVIHDSSYVHFDYNLAPLTNNLADFPYPVAQNVFEPDSLLLVIPDNYSDADLTAAASVAATMGQRTFGNTVFDIITAKEATPARLANTSAIIIGQPNENAFLLDLYQRNLLPTTLDEGNEQISGPSSQPISPDDGVVQEIISEYSDDHVYLIVTGGSDLAVARAAKALSVLEPRYGFEGDLVVIEDFLEFEAETDQPDTFTLADLGFSDTTFRGIGAHKATVDFFVPPDWRLTGTPTLNLSYFHSAALEPEGSGLTVKLNGQPVGSTLVEEGNVGEQQVVIELPAAEFNSGVRNRLSFEAITSLDLPDCTLPDLDLIWFRIDDSSKLELPHDTDSALDTPSLDDPLKYFISRQDLSDIWFSLPANPTREELLGVIDMAAWLGNLTSGPGFAPHVSRGAISDLSKLDAYHLIALGLPTTNPVIAAINDELPQPFAPGEDTLRQQVGNIIYRLPDNFNLGLVQIMPAPWNSQEKAVLVATGTSPLSEQWAIKTLTDEIIYYDLQGNVAFITPDSIETFEATELARDPLAAGATNVEVIAENQPEEEAELAQASTEEEAAAAETGSGDPSEILQKYLPPDASPPILMSQLTFVLIGAGLAIAAMGGILSWRKAR